jgi:hypothetical protein
MNKLCILALFLSISQISNAEEIYGKIEKNQFMIEYENRVYSLNINGNVILNYYQENDKDIYEIHVNPSLMELVIFDRNNKTFEKYYYTKYYMNNNNVITLLAPPHFNTPPEFSTIWKLYINNILINDNIKITGIINFEEDDQEIIIYNNSEVIIILDKRILL